MKVQRPPERMLFGQFLLEQKRITGNELALALYKQSKERITHHTVRRLGDILLQDFQKFKDEADLKQALLEFKDYIAEMSRIYGDARELVHAEQTISGCTDTDDEGLEAAETEVGIDLGDVSIEELQGYVSFMDQFMDATEEVIQNIRLKKCDRDDMIAIARRMGEIRQALISLTKG